MASTKSEDEVFDVLRRHLGRGVADLPCTLAYVSERETTRCVLRAGFGDVEIRRTRRDRWRRAVAGRACARDATELILDDLAARISALPARPWRDPPRAALLLPIAQQGQTRPAGVFIACLNRYRPLDDAYRRFLELLVAQIAAGLANARSYAEERQRAEALAELDRAKTAFFSNVSHEFRTPLTLMMGPLEDLLRERASEMSDEMRASLSVVHRNCVRLLKLVNSLLDFSRLEAGRLHAHYEKVDIGALTADLASVFRAAIERAGLAFRVECEPIADDVLCRPRRCGKRSSSTSCRMPSSTRSPARSACASPPTPGMRIVGKRYRRGHSAGCTAADLRSFLSRAERAVANVRRLGHRTRAGAGAREAARRNDRRDERRRQGTTFTVTCRYGRPTCPLRIPARRKRLQPSDRAAMAFVDEATSWLPQEPAGRRRPR